MQNHAGADLTQSRTAAFPYQSTYHHLPELQHAKDPDRAVSCSFLHVTHDWNNGHSRQAVMRTSAVLAGRKENFENREACWTCSAVCLQFEASLGMANPPNRTAIRRCTSVQVASLLESDTYKTLNTPLHPRLIQCRAFWSPCLTAEGTFARPSVMATQQTCRMLRKTSRHDRSIQKRSRTGFFLCNA